MNKFKTIMMALAMTMFSVQIASAQISGTIDGCTTCHEDRGSADVTLTLSGIATGVTETTTSVDGSYELTEFVNGLSTLTPSLTSHAERGLVFAPDNDTQTFDNATPVTVDFVAECGNETIDCPIANGCGIIENNGCYEELNCGGDSCTEGDICDPEENLCVACVAAFECPAENSCGIIENNGCNEELNCGGDDACAEGDICVDNLCEEDNSTRFELLNLEDYDLPIWDFSDNYEQSLTDNMTTLTYTLIQDSKGKLTGSGKFVGLDNMTIPVEVKGKVKGKKGTVTVKYDVKGKNEEKDKVKNKYTLELVEADNETGDNTLDGIQKGKICPQGKNCLKIDNVPTSLTVDPDMDGGSTVQVETTIDENGKKSQGEAALVLSNDNVYPLEAKGKFNQKNGERKYQLKGDNETTKGIKLKVTVESDNGTATKISGKALGQKLNYKQPK